MGVNGVWAKSGAKPATARRCEALANRLPRRRRGPGLYGKWNRLYARRIVTRNPIRRSANVFCILIGLYSAIRGVVQGLIMRDMGLRGRYTGEPWHVTGAGASSMDR